ncbi:MAG: hypothetical protein L0332_19135 [Chloroflexi bacterium]|nr:hypothetical protein [Chloroflexota bacterium]MCI0577117.1 hypothetical protein [Chloroflexota bacterium]MCI0646840.1 hypothetical protein [Chloroflexota bacterium]MCI0728811.1 hypothetical protein [Chloroflexota bacterium]
MARRKASTEGGSDWRQRQVETVPIEVEIPGRRDNPWLVNFGRFKDDPTFDDLQEKIAAYWRELEEITGSNT